MASEIAERVSRAIALICAWILYATFAAIFGILCTDVVLRYFRGSSLRWASEIPELLFPWLVMAGVVLAARNGSHIATTFLADAVHGRARQVISVIGHLAIVAVYALLAVVAAQAIPLVAEERSPILGVPGSVTYACLLTGFILIALIHFGALMQWHTKPAPAGEHPPEAIQ